MAELLSTQSICNSSETKFIDDNVLLTTSGFEHSLYLMHTVCL